MKKITSTVLTPPTGRAAGPGKPDDRFLRLAFGLARTVKGKTLPNPPVGAVLVRNGRVIGRGATRPAGQAHAEVVALEAAARVKTPLRGAAGATLYVTLEPCNHFGRTPPCTRAIIAAGVTRVVAACPDPNPQVAGRGFAALRRAGIEVVIAPHGDPWRAMAEEFYGGFFFWVRHGRPRVTVKIAQSLDGRINAARGEETPLTGLAARRFAHGLRAQADALLVGAETVRVDDPDLTPRLTPGPAPEILVLSRSGKLPRSSRVFASDRKAKTWVICPKTPPNLPENVGVLALPAPAAPGTGKSGSRLLARSLLKIFAARGYHDVLVEGGRSVWAPFLEAGLCDVLYVLTAPKLLPRGEAWAKELGPAWGKPLVFHRFTPLGQDSLTEFRRRVSER